MAFFQILSIALTKPQEYENLMARPFRAGWGYLFWLLATLVFIFVLIFATPALYTIRHQVARQVPLFLAQAKQAYPPDLIITIKNGTLRMNQPGPVYFDIEWMKDGKDSPSHLVTIDPQASVESYASYHTMALVTATSIIMPRGLDGLQVVSLKNAEDKTIDQTLFNSAIEHGMTLTKWIPLFFFILTIVLLICVPLLAAFFWSLGLLIYLIPMSIITLLIAKLFKRAIDYRNAYRFGLYVLTFPLMAQAITILIGYPLPNFAFSLIFIAATVIIFSISKSEPQGAMA